MPRSFLSLHFNTFRFFPKILGSITLRFLSANLGFSFPMPKGSNLFSSAIRFSSIYSNGRHRSIDTRSCISSSVSCDSSLIFFLNDPIFSSGRERPAASLCPPNRVNSSAHRFISANISYASMERPDPFAPFSVFVNTKVGR